MTNTDNVTSITDKAPHPAARFTINAIVDGFPVSVEVEGKADHLRAMIGRLKSIGAEPPTTTKPQPTKAAGAPLCPVHGSKMKEGRRGFFCPKKVGDGYCKETA